MQRKIGESFIYEHVKLVVFAYNTKHIPINRDDKTHKCYICIFGSKGNTQFACHCGRGEHVRGECGPNRVFWDKEEYKKFTREQKALISTNPNKFK